MAKKDPEDERILRDLLESAMAFHSHGVMSQRTFSEIRALCEPVPAYSPKQVTDLRTRVAKMSQAVFASLLNVSVSTVQKWESPNANKPPQGAAVLLLQILESKGVEALVF